MYKSKSKTKQQASVFTLFAIVQAGIVSIGSLTLFTTEPRLSEALDSSKHSHEVLELINRIRTSMVKSRSEIDFFGLVHRGQYKLEGSVKKEVEDYRVKQFSEASSKLNADLKTFWQLESRHFNGGDEYNDHLLAHMSYYSEVFDALGRPKIYPEWDDHKGFICANADPYFNLRRTIRTFDIFLKQRTEAEEVSLAADAKIISGLSNFRQNVLIGMPLSMLLSAVAFAFAQRAINRKRAQRMEFLRSNIQGVKEGRNPVPLAGNDDLAAIDEDFREVSQIIFEEQWNRQEKEWSD